jgi:hypothetical protein
VYRKENSSVLAWSGIILSGLALVWAVAATFLVWNYMRLVNEMKR